MARTNAAAHTDRYAVTLRSAEPRVTVRRADLDGAVVVPGDPGAELLYIQTGEDDSIQLVDGRGRARDTQRGPRLDFCTVVVREQRGGMGSTKAYRLRIQWADLMELETEDGNAVAILDDEPEVERAPTVLRAVVAHEPAQE